MNSINFLILIYKYLQLFSMSLASEKKIQFLGFSGEPLKQAEDGYSAVGPFYQVFGSGWQKCTQNTHISCVVTVRAEVDFSKQDEWRPLNVTKIENEIQSQVNRHIASQVKIYAWYVLPEELRPWRKNEMHYLELVSSIIKRNSTKPIISYNPANREAEDLIKMAHLGLDVVAKNAYIEMNTFRDSSLIIKSMNVCHKASQSILGRNIQLGVYLKLAKDPINPNDDQFISQLIRHDVYLSILKGAQIVIIWSLFKRPEVKRTYEIQYESYKKVIKEINSLIIDFKQNNTILLPEILLNSKPRFVEHSDDLTYTHAEFQISNTSKLIFDINSASHQLNYGQNETLNPFEVRFKVIYSDD